MIKFLSFPIEGESSTISLLFKFNTRSSSKFENKISEFPKLLSPKYNSKSDVVKGIGELYYLIYFNYFICLFFLKNIIIICEKKKIITFDKIKLKSGISGNLSSKFEVALRTTRFPSFQIYFMNCK